MRSIQEMQAEEARIRAILAAGAEAELHAIPGVVHVSVGLKQINGVATDQYCIRVYVETKRGAAEVPERERIPKRIEGIPTDVNQVQVVQPHEDAAKYRPVTGGCEIAIGPSFGQGTLGCFATDNTDGKIVLLTNFHVIRSNPGEPVYQPATGVAEQIGTVKRGQLSPTMDAAIADIDSGITTTVDEINGLFLNRSNHIAGVADPVAGMRVHKVGRTSGLTSGKVVDADVTTVISYKPPIGPRLLKKLMLIQRTRISGCCCCTCEIMDGSREFSEPGDSGAAIVSDQRMAIGLNVGAGDGQAYGCRMTEIESQLDITVNRTVVAPFALARESISVGAPFADTEIASTLRVPPIGPPPSAEDETVWSALQRRLDESPFGREVGAQVRHHLPEAVELVNRHRAVMVAWQRVKGPSFLAQWMNGVRNPSQPVPKEIDGVTMEAALLALAAVLKSHGSVALHEAIDRYGLDLMSLLDRSETVDALIENLDARVSA